MMTRLPQAVQSYQVKSKGVKNLVKRLEEPGFPASGGGVCVCLLTCLMQGAGHRGEGGGGGHSVWYLVPMQVHG